MVSMASMTVKAASPAREFGNVSMKLPSDRPERQGSSRCRDRGRYGERGRWGDRVRSVRGDELRRKHDLAVGAVLDALEQQLGGGPSHQGCVAMDEGQRRRKELGEGPRVAGDELHL